MFLRPPVWSYSGSIFLALLVVCIKMNHFFNISRSEKKKRASWIRGTKH